MDNELFTPPQIVGATPVPSILITRAIGSALDIEDDLCKPDPVKNVEENKTEKI